MIKIKNEFVLFDSTDFISVHLYCSYKRTGYYWKSIVTTYIVRTGTMYTIACWFICTRLQWLYCSLFNTTLTLCYSSHLVNLSCMTIA